MRDAQKVCEGLENQSRRGWIRVVGRRDFARAHAVLLRRVSAIRTVPRKLVQAHEQASLRLRTPSEGIIDVARVVREITRDRQVGREFHVSDENQELVPAMREFAEHMEKNAHRSAAPTGLNRDARRVKKSVDADQCYHFLPGRIVRFR
ncbi:hypothetical protein GWO62_02925 [Corynebacterium macginleyi]|uniref:hypothetical protein n=1 Tax=Corynebacterium macginleyi TaxID=38290 RepID=UPI00190E425B|nr:hypothetical protein [Corynebacterium macginleyi]MBK4152169.1 hypothetical protein [Corynebacterium macginleyi]